MCDYLHASCSGQKHATLNLFQRQVILDSSKQCLQMHDRPQFLFKLLRVIQHLLQVNEPKHET